ncbi:MAG: prepilin peptidase [Deltaproteobacteria bacterium]|nr:prepilin peptidase [Deltaproteobacteria bacterium]
MTAVLPEWIQQCFVFALGSCLGSFFNVVIHRLPAKLSIVHPASRCPRCGNPIAFYDNIPILSYVVLMGRCRHCKTPISPRYPLVEAITGGAALYLFREYGFSPQFFGEFLFVSLLTLIAFIDLDTFTIPNVLSLPGIAAGLAFSFFTPRLSWQDSLVGVLLGGGFLYAIAVAYHFLRRQEGMGGGDIKLLAMIGAFLGAAGVLFTVMVASVAGALAGIAVMKRRRTGLTAMVPFGPFLSLGAVCYLLWGQDFIHWYVTEFFA